MDNRDLSPDAVQETASQPVQRQDPLASVLSAAHSLTGVASSNFVPAEQVVHAKKKKEKKQERTPGLKLFDVFLYPFLTNFAVFAMSVAATYITKKGAPREDGTLPHGKFGEFMAARGKWLENKFMKFGMSKKSADMGRMVFFSFADGSLMAPVVKLFEDKRESIGKGIDEALGTVPEDQSIYKKEPKQSWWSVLGGRLATVSIVVPTAVGLDYFKINGQKLNDFFFNNPGERMGEWLEKKPNVQGRFKNLDLKYLSATIVFEAFYTSVCTAGLYLTSRFFARKLEKKKDESLTPVPIKIESPVNDAKRDEAKPAFEPKTRVAPQGVTSERLTDPSIGATLA